MYIILGLSILFNIIFLVIRYNHYKSVSESIEQLGRINKESSQMELKNLSTHEEYEELTLEINQLIKKFNAIKTHYRQVSRQHKRMVSSIAHDFRTPLTSMLGYIELLQENPSPEKRENYLSIIEERTRILNDLVNEFYLLSLLDSDSYELTFEEVDPTPRVQERVASYYGELDQHFNEVTVDLNETPLQIYTSMVDFERIIDNLLRNAFNHGVDFLSIKNRVTERSVQYIFTNGLDKEDIIDEDKIFERLYKADHSRTSQSTGLGLAITKELSEKLDYDLEVEIHKQTIQFILTIEI